MKALVYHGAEKKSQNPSASLRRTTNINYKLLAESCGQTKNYKLLKLVFA